MKRKYELRDNKGQLRNPDDKRGLFTKKEAKKTMQDLEANGFWRLFKRKKK